MDTSNSSRNGEYIQSIQKRDFVKLSGPASDTTQVPHKWTFYFLMAVGFWNLVGAGIFCFLINLPIVSYFETGTLLTINHGHAAMMGVFSMLGIGLIVFVIRQSVDEPLWRSLEKYIRVGFWGLNGGLMMMLIMSLFPAGALQLVDVLENGYRHARSLAYTGSDLARLLEWSRMPGDLVFIVIGVVPIAIAAMRAYMQTSAKKSALQKDWISDVAGQLPPNRTFSLLRFCC